MILNKGILILCFFAVVACVGAYRAGQEQAKDAMKVTGLLRLFGFGLAGMTLIAGLLLAFGIPLQAFDDVVADRASEVQLDFDRQVATGHPDPGVLRRDVDHLKELGAFGGALRRVIFPDAAIIPEFEPSARPQATSRTP
jgi:hypothetical protein